MPTRAQEAFERFGAVLDQEAGRYGIENLEALPGDYYLAEIGGDRVVVASTYRTIKTGSSQISISNKKVEGLLEVAEDYKAIPLLGYYVEDNGRGAKDLVLIKLAFFSEESKRLGPGRVFNYTLSGGYYYGHEAFRSLDLKAYRDFLYCAVRFSTTDKPEVRYV